MRAARYHKTGGPEVIQIEEMEVPEPGKGQVRIKVQAAGVNPADWKQRKGFFGSPPPQTVGMEGSGTIDALGEGAEGFQIGAAVFGVFPAATAEYAIADTVGLAIRPATLKSNDAAGVPIAALTAWQDLFDMAKLEKGQRVLIHAAAGGVGSYAVQFARWKGAQVVGTASPENHAYLRELGANETVDYHGAWEDATAPVDVVIDTIGGKTSERSLKILKEGGIMVSLTREPGEASGKRWVFHSMKPKPGQLIQIAELIAKGKIRTNTEKVFPFEQVGEAQRVSEEGHTRGKLIVQVAP